MLKPLLFFAISALVMSCGPHHRQFVVLIPYSRELVGDCSAGFGGHEFEVQRKILCGFGRNVSFRLFNERDWDSLKSVVATGSRAADILVLPFEACPEWVPRATRDSVADSLASFAARGGIAVAASGNVGTYRCLRDSPRRFPADVAHVTVVGSGRPEARNYSLRWRDKPDYFVDDGVESLSSAGSSFACSRYALWAAGYHQNGVEIIRNAKRLIVRPEVRDRGSAHARGIGRIRVRVESRIPMIVDRAPD